MGRRSLTADAVEWTVRAFISLVVFALRATTGVFAFQFLSGGPFGPPRSRLGQVWRLLVSILVAIGCWAVLALFVELVLVAIHLQTAPPTSGLGLPSIPGLTSSTPLLPTGAAPTPAPTVTEPAGIGWDGVDPDSTTNPYAGIPTPLGGGGGAGSILGTLLN
jgi:hypothetical protein